MVQKCLRPMLDRVESSTNRHCRRKENAMEKFPGHGPPRSTLEWSNTFIKTNLTNDGVLPATTLGTKA